MSCGTPLVGVILKNESGRAIFHVMRPVPSERWFSNLNPGKYSITLIPPENYIIRGDNPRNFELVGKNNSLKVKFVFEGKDIEASLDFKEETALPKWAFGATSLALAGASFCGNPAFLGEVAPSVNLGPSQLVKRQIQPGRPMSEFQSRMYDCLESNFNRLTEIPEFPSLSVSDIVGYILVTEEISEDAAQVYLGQTYEAVQRARAVVNECDPTVIQEIIDEGNNNPLILSNAQDGEENNESVLSNVQGVVVIAGECVNVRAEPNLNSEVITQVSYIRVQTDVGALAHLPDSDWHPIILPDARKGFVHSSYIGSLDSYNSAQTVPCSLQCCH